MTSKAELLLVRCKNKGNKCIVALAAGPCGGELHGARFSDDGRRLLAGCKSDLGHTTHIVLDPKDWKPNA